MKKQLIKIATIAFIAMGAISCKDGKKAEASEAKPVEEVAVAEKFKADPAQTMISWDADKLVGGHEGTINASNGVVETKGGKLVGGNFIFDINTIKCTDLEKEEENAKLIGHLKSEDFFDVANHPNGAFEITSVTEEGGKSVIAGNLTLKGVKKNISFPATVSVDGNTATITSDEFNIDRTEWGINYNSGKFKPAKELGDYLIKDNVGIKVNVTASK